MEFACKIEDHVLKAGDTIKIVRTRLGQTEGGGPHWVDKVLMEFTLSEMGGKLHGSERLI